jgi:hypothetical protein
MYLDFDAMSNAGDSSMPGVSMDRLKKRESLHTFPVFLDQVGNWQNEYLR